MLTSEQLGAAIDSAIKLKIQSGVIRSRADVARHFGVKPPSVYDWIKRGVIAKDKIPELISYFSDVVDHTHWGLSDNHPFRVYEKGEQVKIWSKPEDLADSDDSPIWIDRYDYKLSAGEGHIQWEVKERHPLPFNAGVFRHRGANPKDCKLVDVKGDSMEPYLFDKDMVMIDTSKTTPRDSKIYAIYFEGDAYIKQVFKQAGGVLVLHSFNQKYADKIVPNDGSADFMIIGEVIYRSGAGI